MNALPCANQETTMDVSVWGNDSMDSISYNFSGNGFVTPPVFFRTNPTVSGIVE